MNEDLTVYDIKPAAFINYLRYYGEHFNKKLCEFACSKFPKYEYNKERLDSLFRSHNIEIKNAKLYDYVYVANMGKFDYYGSSIPDDTHLAKFIKDYIDDEDGYPEIAFSRFYIDTVKKGIPIDWEAMI